jgi:hypothetical protein
MAEFSYGPYVSVNATGGLAPGGAENWWAGPWSWYGSVIAVTAHPLGASGQDRTLTVSNLRCRVDPNGDRYIYWTVTNVGVDSANYAVWIGGIS